MLLLVGTFLASVHLFLTRDQGRAGPGTRVDGHPRTKLFAFVVDGMRPEDAADPRLAFLAPYREHGFVATVNPCLEALTVPCVNEAMSGTATAGLLGAYQNLVAASASGTSSLFADVSASGRRTAVIHHGQYGGFRSAFSEEYRGRKDDWGAARKFIAAGIDFIVWHYPKLDEAAHHHRVGSKGYVKALDVLQADGAALRAALPPDYKLVVYGDHGHTRDGRHIFGLDIPTVYMTDATWFGTEQPVGRLTMPTYRMLLGAELGILPPLEYDGADLSSRFPEGSAIRAAARGRVYTGPPEGNAFPVGVLLAALALGGGAIALAGGRARWVVAVGAIAAALVGFQYLTILPHIHYTRALPYVGLRVAGGAGVGAAIAFGVGLAQRRVRAVDHSPHTVLAAGALGVCALALPGTLYNYGLFQALPHLLVWAAAFVLVPSMGERRADRRVWVAGALLGGAWWCVSEVGVGTFAIHSYPRVKQLLPWVLPLGWGILAAMQVPVREGAEGEPSATPPPSRRAPTSGARAWAVRVGVGALAALGASGEVFVAGYGLAVVCVTVVALAVWTFRPRASQRALAWGAAALVVATSFGVRGWYGHGDGLAISFVVGMAGAWAVLARESRGVARIVATVGVVVLVYLGMAPSSGLRTNGLAFNFAIAWLPDDMHLRLWPVVAAGLLVKVLAPAFLVLAVARRYGLRAQADVVRVAVAARLATGGAGVAGLLVANAAPPRYRLFEQLEDLVAWSIVAAVVLWSVRGGARPAEGAHAETA